MPFVSLEKVIKRAPLGLRFIDIARDVRVTDGLMVQAQPRNSREPALGALRSPVSGIYGFRSLPGLRDYEWGLRPATDWCANNGTPEEANFVVTVEDQQGRFLSQVLLMCLPKTQLVEVPLYSSPARIPPGGYAIIRGELWNNSTNAPASWAVVTVMLGGYTTVANEKGLFVLFIPYPPLADSPVFDTVQIPELHWPVTVQVLYEPDAQIRVFEDRPPTTASIIAQSAATVFDTPTVSGASLVRNLPYGRELILTTEDQPRLLLNPS